MSGHAEESEALEHGASMLLRKPFSPAELLDAVHAALQQAAPAVGEQPSLDLLAA